MRQKFVFVTAIAVCLTLALVPALADERTIDRHGDRTKAGKGVTAKPGVQIDPSDMAIFTTASGTSTATTTRAASMLSAVPKADPETKLQMLRQLTTMNLESTEQNDAIRSAAFEMLAEQYSASPSRQVMILGKALQFAPDSARRSELESKITALGGDVFALTFNTASLNTYARRDPGADDSCLGAAAVSLPHAETMSIQNDPVAGIVDHNWRSFDLVGAAEDGHFVSIETISDEPGSGTDDTDLRLWDGCPPDGNELAFNQDIPGDFTSRIDSGCLRPGTYYVEVGGFFDQSSPDNFDLEIQITGTCFVPIFDGFEPDNSRADAAGIGHPTPHPPGLGWGRANREIQARSMVNPDREDELGDIDHAEFALTQTSLVRLGTAEQFPTFFNGFTSGSPFSTDTTMGLFFENEPDYGGRCNQSTSNFEPTCITDADCPDPLLDPLPGLPPCIPLQTFPLSKFGNENPIATNDDRPSGGFGSELLVCLPKTSPGTPSSSLQALGGDFLVQVNPWQEPGGINYVDPFDYELMVKNEVGCIYEVEPNGNCCGGQNANPIEVGSTVAAMYDFAATNPSIDRDHFIFDIDSTTNLLFETASPNPDLADTVVQLIVGPSDSGGFFFAGPQDDNSGEGLLSSFTAAIPPASALLGNQVRDANYIVRIFSQFAQPNFYYEFSLLKALDLVAESEPNNSEAEAQSVPFPSLIQGNLAAGCDYDVYQFELTEATFVTIFDDDGAGGDIGDGGLQVTDCSGNVFGCDEDGGPVYLSILDGCLPAGTYCVKYRPWNGGTTFDYDLTIDGVAGCSPTDPPMLNGDNAGRCSNFDSCS